LEPERRRRVRISESLSFAGIGEAPFLSDAQWSAIASALVLSRREAEIARYLLEDDRASGIADRLCISSHTVHTHLERLYRKLGVSSRCQVVARLFAAHMMLDHSPTPAAGTEVMAGPAPAGQPTTDAV
jgi:DNA-binding CsgD family transcriptional regulator